MLENLAEGIDTDDLGLLTTTIERGLSQTPPLQHKTMEEAKTMVEAHKLALAAFSCALLLAGADAHPG